MYLRTTDKFSNNYISVRTLAPLEMNTISTWNVLMWMMKLQTEKFPGKAQLAGALNHAYSTQVRCSLTGYGASVSVEFLFSYIQPSLIDDPDYISEVRDIIDQVLFHPLFDEQSLSEAKWMLENRLARQTEDPDWCALKQAFDSFGDGVPLSVPISGTPQGIQAVTLEEVQTCYETWLHLPRCLYCTGSFSEQMKQALAAMDTCGQPSAPCILTRPMDPIRVSTPKAISQSSLALLYTTETALGTPQFGALYVLNNMLGGGQKSLLFDEIREKHSWCYSISSSLIRFNGLLLVTAGCTLEHIPGVLTLIRRQIETLCHDQFDQQLFESARLELIDGIRSRQDQPLVQLETDWQNHLLGQDVDAPAPIAGIRQVTRQDVVQAAKRLHLIVTSIVEETQS